MQATDIHICLVSDQLLPNLIPILMDRPAKVYLVSSDVMNAKEKDKDLRRILRQQDIEVEMRRQVPSAGIEEIRKFARRLCGQILTKHRGVAVVLNATGGTKLLSMGFVEAFRREFEGHPLRIIYTDTAHQVIESLVPTDQAVEHMRGVLDIPMYLEAQGMRLKDSACGDARWQDVALDRKQLTDYLVSNCEQLSELLGTMNGLVHGTRGCPGIFLPGGETLGDAKRRFKSRPGGMWRPALGKMASSGLIRWDGDKEIEFLSEHAARYLSGGWLEEYAWCCAKEVGFQDTRSSARCQWMRFSGDDAPENEFDLLAVHNNRLLLAECKTGTFVGGDQQSVVSKLESLGRNTGGLFGTSLMLSARTLPQNMRQRLKSLGIGFLEGGNLKDLSKAFSGFFENGSLPVP